MKAAKDGDGRTIAKMQLNQTEVPFRTFVTKKPTPLFDCLSYVFFLITLFFCISRFIFINFFDTAKLMSKPIFVMKRLNKRFVSLDVVYNIDIS